MHLSLLRGSLRDSESPRERCLESGPECLSLRECLAVMLGTGPKEVGCFGLADRILELPGSGLSAQDEERAFFTVMETLGKTYLKSVHGLGPAGQARVLAAFELGRRYTLYRYGHHRIQKRERSHSQLSSLVLEKIPPKFRVEPKEWFGFIPIYRTGEVGELCIVEKGVRTHVNTDPIELFARVLALRPSGFFLAHNHPTGDANASWQDQDLTEKVGKLSKQLGIRLLGHWIVAPQTQRMISFMD